MARRELVHHSPHVSRDILRAPHRIGLVGLGRMGLPICARLVRRGYAVVAHDARETLRESATQAGAAWAPSAAAAAAEADAVLTVLPGPTEVAALIAELRGAFRPRLSLDRPQHGDAGDRARRRERHGVMRGERARRAGRRQPRDGA